MSVRQSRCSGSGTKLRISSPDKCRRASRSASRKSSFLPFRARLACACAKCNWYCFSLQAGVIRDSAGNLYGTTTQGGAYFYFGTVFKLDTAGNETVLYSFTGGAATLELP